MLTDPTVFGRVCTKHVEQWWENLTGQSPADQTRTSIGWLDAVHPEDQPSTLAAWQHAITSGTPYDIEYRVRTRDGGFRHLHARGVPIRGTADDVQEWVGTLTDVTEARRAVAERERLLREVEAERRKLAEVFHHAPSFMCVLRSPTHLFERVNERYLELLDRKDADLLGRTAREAVPEAEGQGFFEILDRVYSSGEPFVGTGVPISLLRGGVLEERFIDFVYQPLRESDGAVTGIIVQGVDQTERKRAETATRLSEERYRLAALATEDAIWDVDMATGAVHRSERYMRAFGQPGETEDSWQWWVDRIHPDDRKWADESLRATIAGAESHWVCAYRFRRADGMWADIEDRGYISRDASGSARRVIGAMRDVTERKRAEAAVRDREQLLAIVTASARVGLVMLSDRYEYLFANEAYADSIGLPVADIVGRRVEEVVPERWPDLRPRLDRALAGEWCSYEISKPAEPGSEPRWFRILCEPRRVEGERPKVVVVGIEITDQKRAEQAVRTSEERYRWLLDVLPVAVFVHDEVTITFCNPAFVRLIGAGSAADLLGTDPFDRVDPDQHALARGRLAQMAATGRGLHGIELRAVCLDGRAVPVLSVSAPLPNHGNASFLVVWADQTERERSAQMLRSVLNSVGDAIVTTDEGGVVVAANPAAGRTFGYPESALAGANVGDLLPSTTLGVDARGGEVEARRRDGSTFPAELTVTEFRFDGERRFTSVVRDITARKSLEAEFRQAQKMEAFGQLAGGVAHDFNNLLTVINGYSAMFLKERPANHPDAESMTEILAAGKRAEDLTRQLLAFGRRQVLQPKELNLNDLISNLLKMLGRLLGEDVQLSTTLSPSLGTVRADPGQLEQVIVNLCVNARDAMPTGGRLAISTSAVKIKDTVSRHPQAVPPGQYSRIAVTDTGCGMTDAVRAKIFEPFFTTKPVGQGTGLGLSTVFGIVEQSGGHITVTTEVGRGTTFEVYLPVIATESATPLAAEATTPTPGGRETVLLVEDERSVRKLTAMLLRNAGYRVLEADGGDEAARVYERAGSDVQLLVTDVVMPRESGRELAARLTRVSPGLRVLFMSGYTDDRVMRHGIQSSEVAFIQKPFDVGALLVKIREVLDRPVV